LRKPPIQHLFALLSHLSLRGQYRLADLMGLLVRNTPNQISRQTRENIELCFGDLEAQQRQRLYRESIRHTCYTLVELAAVWHWPVDRVLSSITSTDICAEFARGSQGRIIIAPHLGSWETLAIWLGQYCNAIMLYKKRNDATLDCYITAARARSGGRLVPTGMRGLRELLVGLQRGDSLMILPDQKPGMNKAGVESQFFGRSAPTTSLVRNLCSKLDCDVFIASMCRATPPGEFNLEIQPLDHRRLAAAERESAQYMNDQIESLVRQHPEQYQWGYRRFSASCYALHED